MTRHLSLVADASPGTHSRRRADCGNLAECEWAWVSANGSKQASCPPNCGDYVQALRVARMQSGGGAIVMRGES